jgi:hypothetical protein
MDTFSHAAWGGAVSRHKRMAWWGALAGAAPDLLWFIPTRVELLLEKGWAGMSVGGDPGMWRDGGPPLPPELIEAYHRYYVNTHSLVLLAGVAAIVSLTRARRWAWLAVPYALHILMDIPTHERYQTQPLHPLSSWSMVGLSWSDPRIFFPNVIALAGVWGWLWMRNRRKGSIAGSGARGKASQEK